MIGILLDENGNFVLDKGLIAVGDANLQTADSIIRANRGEFKELPMVGGEVLRMMGGQPSYVWCVEVERMMAGAGLKGASVTMDDQQIEVKL